MKREKEKVRVREITGKGERRVRGGGQGVREGGGDGGRKKSADTGQGITFSRKTSHE